MFYRKFIYLTVTISKRVTGIKLLRYLPGYNEEIMTSISLNIMTL